MLMATIQTIQSLMQLCEEGTRRAADKVKAKQAGKAGEEAHWGLICSMCSERTCESSIARRYTAHTFQHLVVWLCACLRHFGSSDTWSRHAREGGCRASTRAAKILANKASSFAFVVDRAGVSHAIAFARKHWAEYIKNKASSKIVLKAGKDYRVTNPSREVVFEPIPFTAARLPCQESRAEVDGMGTASVPAPLKKRATKDAKAAKPSVQVQPSPLNKRATAGGKAPKSTTPAQPSCSKRSGNTVRDRLPTPKRTCLPAIHPAFARWVPVGKCVEVMSEEDERWFRGSCRAVVTHGVAEAKLYLEALYNLLTSVGDITWNERRAIQYLLAGDGDRDGADRHASPFRGLLNRLKYGGELSPHEYAVLFVFVRQLESGSV